jgi:hypothetical protein
MINGFYGSLLMVHKVCDWKRISLILLYLWLIDYVTCVLDKEKS